MRSIKNVSMICLAAMVVLLAFTASPVSAADNLPEHSIYIGDTAVSIGYLMNSPVEAQALVNKLLSEQGLGLDDLWFQIFGEPVLNIGTGAEATPEEISEISGGLDYWYDAEGVEHDMTYTVTFTIVDVDEAAIANATVSFNGAVMLTSETGVAVFEDVEAAEYVFMISKEGYMSVDGTVTVVDEDVDVATITLAEENDFSIVNVEALDVTTLKVTFADGTVIEEADLEDQIIQVLVADLLGATSMNATYQAGTLNTTTLLANFTLAGDDKFVDTVTYFVDADWTTFDEDSFVARIAAEYVASFYKETTEVIAYDNTTIFFGALNQYGEEIELNEAGTISITCRLNGMAIPSGQILYTNKMDNVTVNRALAVDDILRLTVKNTVGADVKAENVLQYTVIEGDTPIVTTFTLAANQTSVPAGDDVKFTVTAKDQYNNPFNVTDKIQWEIEGEIVAGNDAILVNTTQTANPALEVAAFYVPNPAKNAVVTIEVVASSLTGITLANVAPADKFNYEEVTWFCVNPGPTGAVINKDALEYNVTAMPANATADDIAIVFNYGTGANATKVFAGITTQVAGAYTFNVTHPLADDAEADVWETITTTINPALDQIDIEEIGANELLAGGYIFKNVTFWNVHNEQLNRTADNIALASSELTLTAGLLKADDEAATGADNVSKLNLTGVNSGTAWFQLVLADDDYSTGHVEVTVGGIAGVKTVDMDAEKYLIQQDDYNNTEAEIIFDNAKVFAIMPVTFKNQYGDTMTVLNSSVEYTGLNATDPKFEFISLKTVTGNYTKVTDNADVVTGIGVYATANAATADTFEFGVKTSKQAPTGYNPATVTATVGEARNVTSFDLSEDAVTLTIAGANQTVYITTFDQYTNPRNVAVANINVTSADQAVVTNTTLTYVAPGNYSFALAPGNSGGDKISVNVNVTGGNTNVPAKDNDQKITVTVAASLKDAAVPGLVSGNMLQEFEGLDFTLVGNLAADEKVEIDISALAAAGVDFSAVNGTKTIAASTNADNFTFNLIGNKITLNATVGVSDATAVSLNFRNDADESAFVNVTAGAAGQHDVVFSRIDAVPTVTKKCTIAGNIINGMATNLTNNEQFDRQDFTFTVDGTLAELQTVQIIIPDVYGLGYSTDDLSDNYEVTGANMRVLKAGPLDGNEHVIQLRAESAVPSDTEVTVRAVIVDASLVCNKVIGAEVKRIDNGNSDEFNFSVGGLAEPSISPVVATVGVTKITADFWGIENDDRLKFQVNSSFKTAAAPFVVNLTNFDTPFGTTSGTMTVDGANITALTVTLKDTNHATKIFTPVTLRNSESYNVITGNYDFITINGTATGPSGWMSLAFEGDVTGVDLTDNSALKFVIGEATNLDSKVNVMTWIKGVLTADQDITLTP